MRVRAKKDCIYNGMDIKQGEIIEVGDGLKDHLPTFLEAVEEETASQEV